MIIVDAQPKLTPEPTIYNRNEDLVFSTARAVCVASQRRASALAAGRAFQLAVQSKSRDRMLMAQLFATWGVEPSSKRLERIMCGSSTESSHMAARA